MSVDKSWHEKTSVEIDYLCSSADERSGCFIAADVDNASFADGDGLDDRATSVGGKYFAVAVQRSAGSFAAKEEIGRAHV